MRQSIVAPLLICLAALACFAHAQDAVPAPMQTRGETVRAEPTPQAEVAGPGWYERGGWLDQNFAVVLEGAAWLPFYDLLQAKPPAYPWADANGKAIDADSHAAVAKDWGAIVSGAAVNPHPLPWRDQTGAEITLSPQGQPVLAKLPFLVVWLVIAAVFFTLLMRFVNFRLFAHAIDVVRGKFDRAGSHGEVTHFQALSSALSATVGLGNIAGVAIAISLGGPGATIWMIIAGLLGMTLKFTECTLGQRYREIDSEGRVLGGPMRYLSRGLAEKGWPNLGAVLALMFAVFCIGGSLAGGNSFQVNQALTIVEKDIPFFAENHWAFGLIMAVLVGFVIIGGIQRIARTASKIVPAMCLIYVLAALIVLTSHASHIPEALGAMFQGAFSGDAIYGGTIGALIMGFQRAAFSNEAGVGSASIAHSAAKTDYPVREGIVALLEPFIDTVLVCTMTALVITITGVYNEPAYAVEVAGKQGAALTRSAFATVEVLNMHVWFPYVLLIAVVLFAFSTMISWSYYGERCWVQLFGPASSIVYKLLFLVFVFLGSVVSAGNVLEFGDLMILIMAFPNILGLYFLAGVVRRELTEYEAMLASGKFRADE